MAESSEPMINCISLLTWHIENFSMCPQKKSERIRTPDFVVDGLNKSTWNLELFPRGDVTTDGKCVSCYLRRANKEGEEEKISICFHIQVVTSSTQLYKLTTAKHTLGKGDAVGCVEFLTSKDVSEDKDEYLPNDILTISCAMSRSEISENEAEIVDVSASTVNKTYSLQEIFTFSIDTNNSWKKHFDHCIVNTRIPVQRSQISWIINDFETLMQSGKRIQMPLGSEFQEKTKLLVHCYLSHEYNFESSVRFDVKRKDKDFKQMFLRCKVTMLDRNGVGRFKQEGEHYFGDDYEIWSFPPIVKLSQVENCEYGLLIDGALTLQCEFLVSYRGEEVTVGGNCDATNDNMIIAGLMKDPSFTDATLISEDTNLSVHKSIICARSPVFRAMFSNDTEERRTGIVRITDTDAGTLKEMINFIHCDDIPDLPPEEVMKLYSAADKYQIPALKNRCAASLKCDLSLSNVCDILVLADLHSDRDLLKYVLGFIYVHEKDVFKSTEWNKFMKDNVQLALGVMQKVLVQSFEKRKFYISKGRYS